jgi:2-polyprenyl-3-methyl-5-hydroxy-6-metoxy-1,4-benzoquinol methylase
MTPPLGSDIVGEKASTDRAIRTRPAKTCLLCGAPGVQRYGGLTDRLYDAPGEWSLAGCLEPACGLVWLDPMPLAEDLSIAYESYFTHSLETRATSQSAPSKIRTALRAVRGSLISAFGIERERRRLAFMDLADEPAGRLLELGSGDGTRLTLMRSHGWAVEGQDVDPNADAFRLRAEGLTVHLGPLDSLELPGGVYDAVVMSHVIEHVPDPIAVMRECGRLLKPGGSVIAVTPNNRSLGARLFGRSWMALEPPRHLYLFNSSNLQRLARIAGFARSAVRTSYANADGMAVGSLSIHQTGRFALERGATTVRQSLGGIIFQAAEVLSTPFVHHVGEECVLRAWK